MTLATKTLAQLARLNSGIGPVPQSARPRGNTAATGTITAVATASLVDGETFTLDDGINAAVVFEFDKASDGVTGGRVAIDISALTTADQVRDAIITAIGLVPTLTLAIGAASGGAGIVALTNDLAGDVGNLTPAADTVANAGFIVSAMAGGIDYPTTFPATDGAGVDVSDVSRAVLSVTPGADVVFSVVSRTTGTANKFEPLNNLQSLTARAGIGWKEIVNVGSEDELAIYIESGTAPLETLVVTISPCTGA